jgi:hypothetical protein
LATVFALCARAGISEIVVAPMESAVPSNSCGDEFRSRATARMGARFI